MGVVQIDNVVCTFKLGVESISLEHLYCSCPAFEYNPAHFGAAVMNVDKPKCTFLIFSSASGVCVGAHSTELAHLGLTMVIQLIRRCGFKDVYLQKFKVRNIVGSVHLGSVINLEKIAAKLEGQCSYNPELFPGLRCKPIRDHSSSALIYATGSMVITGCNTVDECEIVANKIIEICKCCDADDNNDASFVRLKKRKTGSHDSVKEDFVCENGSGALDLCVASCNDASKLGLSAQVLKQRDAWENDDQTKFAFFVPTL